MKAIIPVAGKGERLKPHTYSIPKALLYVAGKPILGHILDELITLGIKEVVFVIGYLGEKIREYVDNNYSFKSYYVYQEEPEGLGHAIYLTKSVWPDSNLGNGSEPALIILGDTIFKTDLQSVLKGDYSCIGIKPVADPRRFGTVEIDSETGFIIRLEEKSKDPKSNLAIVGIYYIKNVPLLYDCLEEIISKGIKTAGEYQLTDALNLMVQEKNEKMKTFLVEGWYDCGKRETLLETNKYLLEQLAEKNKTKQIPNCIVIPPVFVSDSAKIENSIIGPYVSVANGSIISGSIIMNSIINKNATIKNMLLTDSLIGDNAVVIGKFDRLNVGDSSEVDFT